MKIPFNIDLTNKVAVVTGGGGVICADLAKALAECGAKVAIIDLNKENADKVAHEIKSRGKQALGIEADVLDRDSLNKAHKIILDTFGKCDILINGAGGNHPKGTTSQEYFRMEDLENKDLITFFDLDKQSIEFVFNLNFLGTLLPTQVFSKDMLEKKGCTIINISSMNAYCPLTKIPAYSGAKAAVSNFTQWLAVHFSKIGIRVNAIAPGFFLTNQNFKLLKNDDGSYTERAQKVIAATPMECFGQIEDLIGPLLFLTDEKASSFITGVVIPVDGGFSAYSGV